MVLVKEGSKFNIKITQDSIVTSVRVVDVILDNNHPKFEALGGWDSLGTIFYSQLEEVKGNPTIETTNIAKPLFPQTKYYPLINEIVLLLQGAGKLFGKTSLQMYYFPNLNIWSHPHHNALPSKEELRKMSMPKDADSTNSTTNDYQQAENGIIRKSTDGTTDISLG